MKKERPLKNLALLGIASGLLLTAHASIAEAAANDLLNQQDSTMLLAGKCGAGKCGGRNNTPRPKRSSELAENDDPAATTKIQNDKDSKNGKSDSDKTDYNAENLTYHQVTEDELFGMVNSKSWALYQSLDPEGKALALKLASQTCNNTNDCKGQNACKTDQNDCAGQGSCKGKSKCAFGNKNDAVKVAAKLMAEKRGKLNGK
jgi:hypothetical protein